MSGDFKIGRVLMRHKAVSDEPPLRRNRERPRVRADNDVKMRYKRGRDGNRSAESIRSKGRERRARPTASGWAAAAAARRRFRSAPRSNLGDEVCFQLCDCC